MKKLTTLALITSFVFFGASCTPKEMYLSDPIVNIENDNVKKVLFIGFNYKKDLKLNENSKKDLNTNLKNEFNKFESIKIIDLDEKDLSLNANKILNESDIKNYIDKYNCDLVIAGYVSDYDEIKYLDQPAPVVYPDSTFNTMNNSSTNNSVSTVRIQVSIEGGIYFINKNNKIIWSQPITDYETVQFDDGRVNVQTYNDSDRDIIQKLRQKLLNNTNNKIIKNLLPYYSYK